MNYDIAVELEHRVAIAETIIEALQAAAALALQAEGVGEASLTLLLTDDARLQDLNRQFRGVDSTTDVLSFPAGDDFPTLAAAPTYLGDIAISIPQAARQAQASGHALLAELQLLTVHGVLHLLGFDHLEAEEKAQMWSVQSGILSSLGLENIAATEQ